MRKEGNFGGRRETGDTDNDGYGRTRRTDWAAQRCRGLVRAQQLYWYSSTSMPAVSWCPAPSSSWLLS